MHIVDGTGKGFRVKVGEDNRLFVKSTSDLVIAAKSFEDGDAYQMLVPTKTLGGTAEHNVFYLKNTSSDRYMAINRYILSWNGGSTNRNRTVTAKQYIGATAPSAANTVSGAGNLNTSSGNAAPLTVNYWDGTGTTGMTVSSRGSQAGEVFGAQGSTQFDVQGSTIIGPGVSFLVTLTGEEIGTFAITLGVYFLDKE